MTSLEKLHLDGVFGPILSSFYINQQRQRKQQTNKKKKTIRQEDETDYTRKSAHLLTIRGNPILP